eukprot:469986-Rhodomonas_salina.1
MGRVVVTVHCLHPVPGNTIMNHDDDLRYSAATIVFESRHLYQLTHYQQWKEVPQVVPRNIGTKSSTAAMWCGVVQTKAPIQPRLA